MADPMKANGKPVRIMPSEIGYGLKIVCAWRRET
jgi:hypothetical protein